MLSLPLATLNLAPTPAHAIQLYVIPRRLQQTVSSAYKNGIYCSIFGFHIHKTLSFWLCIVLWNHNLFPTIPVTNSNNVIETVEQPD